jgi:O-antigen/teichoic acid export membrane protein
VEAGIVTEDGRREPASDDDAHGDVPAPPRSLRSAAIQGVRWTSLARVVIEGTALASSLVLARLIPPSAFGAAAVALTVSALAVVIGPPGVTAHVVHRRALTVEGMRSAWFLAFALGLALSLATLGFGLYGAEPLFGEEVAHLVVLVSPAWFVTAFGAVPYALLQRELRFKRIALIDSCTALGGVTVTLVAALAGLDASALIFGSLTTFAVSAAMSMASTRLVWPRPTRAGLAQGRGSVTTVTASSVVYSLYRNIDYAILAWRLSPTDVGLYYRAYQLGVDYQGKVSQIMVRVSFPVFSRAIDVDELRRFRRRMVEAHATTLIPILAAFAALAPDLIPWLYGDAWEGSVLPAQILSLAGMAACIGTGTGPLLIAANRSGTLLRWSLGQLVVYTAVVILFSSFGLIVVCIAVSVFSVTSVLFLQVAILRPMLHLSSREILKEPLPGVVVGLFVFVSIEVARAVLDGADIVLLRLVVAGSVGVVTGLLVVRLLYRHIWATLASIGPGKRPTMK